DSERIRNAMNAGYERFVKLKSTVPVFIVYFTAFVDAEGRINFRKDIYERDDRLADMLLER
ncbi:MAG: L,D-transpeptidase family protein, partial [Daejeonella sp.]